MLVGMLCVVEIGSRLVTKGVNVCCVCVCALTVVGGQVVVR